MRGPLRPSPWIQHQFFPSNTRKLSHFTQLSFFSFFGGGVIFCQIGLECDSMWNYRRLTRNRYLAHISENVIPGDFSPPPKKKRKKRENHRVRRFYGVRRSCRARGFYSMCTSLAVECDALAGVRRICGTRRIPSMHGWYRDHIGKFRGQNQNSNPKASPNFQGHTSGFYFSEFTLGEVPGKKLFFFLLSQPLKSPFSVDKWGNFLIKAAFNSFNIHSCFGTTYGIESCGGAFGGFAVGQLFPPDGAEMPIKVNTKIQVWNTMKTWYAKIFRIWEYCL